MFRRALLLANALAVMVFGALSMAGLPNNGLPDNGLPNNGLPNNGLPNNGLPNNGISTDGLIQSPLFFDPGTHAAWVHHPFTAASISAGPLKQTITDPFSALVMSYQWQLCHPAGDDATITDSFGQSHTFYGLLGLCVLPGGHGWHKDQPLDLATARWLSAGTVTQVNQFAVHNRYSVRGNNKPTLTNMTKQFTSYIYQFGTHDPVVSFGACSGAASGQDTCGWKPHFVGMAKAGSKVVIEADSHGKKILLQINLGIHGATKGGPGVIATSGPAGVVNPKVEFTVPVGGTFNVQWAADPRPSLASAAPKLKATVKQGGGTLRFPADEIFAFPNREMYATAMMFNLSASDNNIANIPGTTSDGKPVANCGVRINSDGRPQFCVEQPPVTSPKTDAQRTDQVSCIPCTRNLKPGGKFVVFPNAHMWLSSSWTNQQDYYALRSCSSNLSTCVAKYEGLIDGGAHPCAVQSANRDTTAPLPYQGGARPLEDAAGCHIGAGADTGFGETTFFANYGNVGACWAAKPGDRACAYKPPKGNCKVKSGHGKGSDRNQAGHDSGKHKGGDHDGDDDDDDCDRDDHGRGSHGSHDRR